MAKWQDRAACRGLHRVFCPAADDEGDELSPRERARRHAQRRRDARKVCMQCPVQVECVDDAIRNPALDRPGFPGIWGGYEQHQLIKVRKLVYGY